MKIDQTRKHLAQRYNCDPRTLKRWLAEIGITHNKGLKKFEVKQLTQYLEEGIKPAASLGSSANA